MGLIGISGHMGSGKDTVGKIIQYITDKSVNAYYTLEQWLCEAHNSHNMNQWQIKKFADKLKDCVCLITGCSRDDLEDAAFKNTQIPGYDGVWLVYTDKYQDTPYSPEWFESEEAAEKFISEQNCVYFHQITPATLTYRRLLQQLGTDTGRAIHPDIWTNALMSEYTGMQFNFHPGYYRNTCSICGNRFMADKRQPVCEPCCNKVFYPNWIITDMRFPNELKAVKDREGITIRVNRLSVEQSAYERAKHESETALDNATFDYVIENNGTIKELVEKVREILIKEKLL